MFSPPSSVVLRLLGLVRTPGGLVKHRLLGPMQEFLNQWSLRFGFNSYGTDVVGLATTHSEALT